MHLHSSDHNSLSALCLLPCWILSTVKTETISISLTALSSAFPAELHEEYGKTLEAGTSDCHQDEVLQAGEGGPLPLPSHLHLEPSLAELGRKSAASRNAESSSQRKSGSGRADVDLRDSTVHTFKFSASAHLCAHSQHSKTALFLLNKMQLLFRQCSCSFIRRGDRKSWCPSGTVAFSG